MIEQMNSHEVAIGLGIFEGRLHMAKDSLSHLHNRADDIKLRLDIIGVVQIINKMMSENIMHLGKLSYDKADDMKNKIKRIISTLALYQRKLSPDLLPYVGRVVASLNDAKDVLQEVINDITTNLQIEKEQRETAHQTSQINPE